MLQCDAFYNLLKKHGITFFTGVPDSLLKDFCAYVADHTDPKNNIVAANEGGAVALAAGHHLATGNIGLVYMQNAGVGNAVNPLVSLVDGEVYSIPVLLFIGWRGEPGVKDEPQHIKQGRITIPLLEVLGIPHEVLPDVFEEAKRVLKKAVGSMTQRSAPYVFIIRKGIFEPYLLKKKEYSSYKLTRERVIQSIAGQLDNRDIVISTTGKTSRELFEYRERVGQDHSTDFLTVGSMGHVSQIALGLALSKPKRNVYCLDGDGSLIMHMGSLAINGTRAPKNFKHIVLNNGAHDSVGGQPTAGFKIDIVSIAKACGYKAAFAAEVENELLEKIHTLEETAGPVLLEVRINTGSRKDLGRPTIDPKESKKAFTKFLQDND